MFASKKMTPPGHWIAIARTVMKNKKIDLMKCTQIYAVTALALHDAFIASWDEKYSSNRIRPVTVIGQFIDPDWMPFLETPSFPEYVSGHSAISASAGTVLTYLLGDSIPFSDSTEFIYGHGVRRFSSFKQAYSETSDSRVYGGIHYRDGVDAGMKQGEEVGNWVLKKLRFK
jgi:membrane-associated phospholipid phosphatase